MSQRLRRFRPMEYAVGTDGTIAFALQDDDGSVLDPTAGSAKYFVYQAAPRRRAKPFVGSPVLEKTSAAGGITLASGSATVTITDADLADRRGQYWHALQLTDASGNISYMGGGRLDLMAAIG